MPRRRKDVVKAGRKADGNNPPPPKPCRRCGREITWRRKWARDWENVRYCSDACRRAKPDDADARLEATILALLAEVGAGGTICPSEAARQVFPGDWRGQMERTRQAARRLQAARKLRITQGGREVDPSRAKGPIRLRRH